MSWWWCWSSGNSDLWNDGAATCISAFSDTTISGTLWIAQAFHSYILTASGLRILIPLLHSANVNIPIKPTSLILNWFRTFIKHLVCTKHLPMPLILLEIANLADKHISTRYVYKTIPHLLLLATVDSFIILIWTEIALWEESPTLANLWRRAEDREPWGLAPRWVARLSLDMWDWRRRRGLRRRAMDTMNGRTQLNHLNTHIIYAQTIIYFFFFLFTTRLPRAEDQKPSTLQSQYTLTNTRFQRLAVKCNALKTYNCSYSALKWKRLYIWMHHKLTTNLLCQLQVIKTMQMHTFQGHQHKQI